jgi:DNA-binding winged helix-turn-helix (wHTH) protein
VLFLFANHILDIDRRELRRGSEPIAVEPQVFDLLVYLVQNRDRVVSKDDLTASVWGRPDRVGFDADQPHQRRAQGGPAPIQLPNE